MSTRQDSNKIIIPIEISLEDKQEYLEILNKTQEVVASGNVMDLDKEGMSELSLRGGLSTASRGVGIATTFGAGTLVGGFAKFMPYIAEALLAIGLAKEVEDFVFRDGGPLDRRFKRDIPDEMYGLISLQEQQSRRIGLDQVIVTSFTQFHNFYGANVTNTLAEVRKSGISIIGLEQNKNKTGLLDKASGWRPNS